MMDVPQTKRWPLAVVGLTGGIASGKSTVGALMGQEGVPVVDADDVAREVVAPGSAGLTAIREAFGDSVLQKDGSLDRGRMAAIVFHDPEARRVLEAVTHPAIARVTRERMETFVERGARWAVYEAALLVETGRYDELDALVVVVATPEQQIERAVLRGGLTREEARARLDSQLPLSQKRAVADYVIDNVRDLADTERQVAELIVTLRRRFGS